MAAKQVPELYATDLKWSCKFYCEVLDFSLVYQRIEELFVYIRLQGSDLMLEEICANHRRWFTGELVRPLSRGLNLKWQVDTSEQR